MWIIYSIIIHIVLLGSIFEIYFRSPVLTGLEPEKLQKFENIEAPAKRLVLIVTDGLRAESFFRNECADVPYLKKLMLQEGMVGISRTHVPTESRPGHIALIAGLYEDPSAVTKGWKENPIDFDHVFNRSRHTYAWGAKDILHIFSKTSKNGRPNFFFDSYNHELDFSGKDKTYKWDEWVFNKTQKFLLEKGKSLLKETQVIFFLHLLGLDTAGHVHKPGKKLFLENLHYTDEGIWKFVKQFNQIFNDNRTTFLLTSDHGMTDSGSHGAGSPLETETPFFIWGAGVPNKTEKSSNNFSINGVKLPLYELEQAQFAPLMSAFLGLSMPVNNFGILPRKFLNVTPGYEAMMVHQNALQLLGQFRTLQNSHKVGLFSAYLKDFSKLNDEKMMLYEKKIEMYAAQKKFEAAINAGHAIMDDALEGIEYYQNYYCNVLLCCTALTFIGWILYLIILLIGQKQNVYNVLGEVFFIKIGVLLMIGILLFLQKVPITAGILFIMPFVVWFFLVDSSVLKVFHLLKISSCWYVIMIFLVVEVLVFSFFDRRLITLGYILNSALNYQNYVSIKTSKKIFWLAHAVLLAGFPFLPPRTRYNNIFLYISIVMIAVRIFLVKTSIHRSFKVLCCAGLLDGLFCFYCRANQIKVPIPVQVFSWFFLFYAFAAVFLYKTSTVKQRLEILMGNFMVLYSLFCTSHESLFILLLTSEILTTTWANYFHTQLPLQIPGSGTALTGIQLQVCLRLAFSILFYTIFSFFGTGNIASISSYDPNIIRCFLKNFSPYIITGLVILKLLIPLILIISIIFAINSFARFYEREIFISLLILCDIMGLNFLFFVTNKGSWKEIGSSISHFVIMEVTTVVLLIVTYISKVLLRLNVPPKLN